ncbi:hypothetical protein D9M71_398470 [compost metagenome]
MFGHLAADFDHVLLFELGNIIGQLANDAPILAEHLQATGARLQLGGAGQAQEMTLERTLAITVFFGKGGRRDDGQSAFGIKLGGLVEQQGHGLWRIGLGIRGQFHLLIANLELRFVDDFAIYRDPAAFDEQLGLPTGATDQLDEAF